MSPPKNKVFLVLWFIKAVRESPQFCFPYKTRTYTPSNIIAPAINYMKENGSLNIRKARTAPNSEDRKR
jgi:hypothetical protein